MPRPTTSRFVRACLRQPVDRTPVWFLRQAGRYMPEYMAIRKHHSLLDICRTPSLAAEVTITAAERLSVDAAIIFADLLLPLTPMGLDFEFVNGEGPIIHQPLRTLDQVRALRTDRTADLRYVSEAINKVAKHFASKGTGSGPSAMKRISSGDQPRISSGLQAAEKSALTQGALAPEKMDALGIIGFCGAPFTLASYMIEGGSSRSYIETKKLMYASPASDRIATQACHPDPEQREGEGSPHFANVGPPSTSWPLLMGKLVTVLAAFAQQQVEAGADVIQVFDSWAGALSVTDYRNYVLDPTKELIRRIQAFGVPVIYFGVDTASLLPTFRETGADVIGLDWRIPLDEGWRAVGPNIAVQGNLDSITLFAPDNILEARVREILAQAANRPGHIFNLGHGIVPNTPVEAVLRVVDLVKHHGVHATPVLPTKPRANEPPAPELKAHS
ncbi:MAG TPA: uroporphyrinogen decarboxylase [Acidobacteriaceae bacterium]|jgi:uroporphyrinogen decarboxylase|nr:uroporphyrinogen decarboxylase [Acidobacteriaceae bacterium]